MWNGDWKLKFYISMMSIRKSIGAGITEQTETLV